MSGAKEVKARRSALQERRRALEIQLEDAAPAERRKLRLELAGLKEDIADCNQRLRELMPKHRVSIRTTWAGVDGCKFDQLQYKTWAELEGVETPEGPTDHDLMVSALYRAADALTPKQAEYLKGIQQGHRAAEVARAAGVNRSTVSRTLKRGRANLEREAKSSYILRKAAVEQGSVNLAETDQLTALLELLTTRQQLYLTLYYGDWMSLREIGSMLGVDHSTVLRGIRRGLERLTAAVGAPARIEGMEHLENLLMAHYNDLPPEAWQTPREIAAPESRGCYRSRDAPPEGEIDPAASGLQWPTGGAGKLRTWLEARRDEASAAGFEPIGAVRRLLVALFRLVRQTLKCERR